MNEISDYAGHLLIVVDYNLTRIDDVRRITGHASERYGLKTALVRPNLEPHDYTLADHLVDLDPLSTDFAAAAARAIASIGAPVAAVLPFSDNAVHSGALLAERLGARGDAAEPAAAAFSKQVYRQREHECRELYAASGVHVPVFSIIHSAGELAQFAERCPGGFVVKPSCEGNNRGVLRLDASDDLEAAFAEIREYVAQGLICEELIDYPEEYSHDGIGHLGFVTRKLSASGRYPVERGQLVGGSLPAARWAAVARAGTLANVVCGQRIGPFHNEVKLDPQSGRTAIIEPNRRPAGMYIWHLAKKVYGVDFFHLWIDQLVTGDIPCALPPPRGAASIRMLPAPVDVVLDPASADLGQLWLQASAQLAALAAQMRGELDTEFFDFELVAGPGAFLPAVPRDNSHFMARISAYSPRGDAAVLAALDWFEHAWMEVAGRLLCAAPARHEVQACQVQL